MSVDGGSPARHPAAARHRTGVSLRTNASRNSDPSPAPPATNPSQTQPPVSQLHHTNANRPQTRSLASIKHANKSQPLLTPPKATIATPLLKPATDTGVYLQAVVPSPTCASDNNRRQPETRLPPAQSNSPIKSKHLRTSLVRIGCIPSTTPRRCSTLHRNGAENHASRNNDPSPAPPAINPSQTQHPNHKLNRNRQTSHQMLSVLVGSIARPHIVIFHSCPPGCVRSRAPSQCSVRPRRMLEFA